ncbi:MAG TPA: chromate transporter [Candidatus Saccharimonadales bacterium]|nr:chromate transporter [Candidatus Saccharimonadales bacterium]
MASILRRFFWVGLTAFGAARWTGLEAAFVRTGLLRAEDFTRDLAIANTLPGPAFVNLTALCAMRLGGLRLTVAAITLIFLPGVIATVAALAWLSTSEPWVAHFFRGILVGAVGVLAAAFWKSAIRLRGSFAASLAAATLLLVAAGAPMIAAVLVVAAVGVVGYRRSPQTLP